MLLQALCSYSSVVVLIPALISPFLRRYFVLRQFFCMEKLQNCEASTTKKSNVNVSKRNEVSGWLMKIKVTRSLQWRFVCVFVEYVSSKIALNMTLFS